MTTILFTAITVYLILTGCLSFVFILAGKRKPPLSTTETASVIISARNEERHIGNCLSSILQQDFPSARLEIILIDDASSDNTFSIAEQTLAGSPFTYRILRNEEHKGKKRSLQKALELCTGELIITRDADTFTHSPLWLQSLTGGLSRADLVIGPIEIATDQRILSFLDWCENAALTVISGGCAFFRQPFLASGANLAFRKKIYHQAGGYSSHLHIASGDDVFLLRDIKKIGGRILFLKDHDAIVHTFPASGIKNMISQKSRWAGKILKGQQLITVTLAGLVFLTNGLWIFCLANLFKDNSNPVHLFFVTSKVLADLMIVLVASVFFRRKGVMLFALPLTFIYPFYACFIGILSPFKKVSWK